MATILVAENDGGVAPHTVCAEHGRSHSDVDALGEERHRQAQLLLRIIADGSDPLVLAVYHRLCEERTRSTSSTRGSAASWTALAHWGKREGLLSREETQLLCRIPLTRPWQLRRGTA